MLDLFLQNLILHKKEVQKANQYFLLQQYLVFQCKCYELEVLGYSV